MGGCRVSVPYEITLLSNSSSSTTGRRKFQYLMKLHYSQTTCDINDYTSEFQYLMKLHYSQTGRNRVTQPYTVSVPYEITLLSNISDILGVTVPVSVPYEITLLSNPILSIIQIQLVSVPYEITLLSNSRLLGIISLIVSVPYEITLLSNQV